MTGLSVDRLLWSGSRSTVNDGPISNLLLLGSDMIVSSEEEH